MALAAAAEDLEAERRLRAMLGSDEARAALEQANVDLGLALAEDEID